MTPRPSLDRAYRERTRRAHRNPARVRITNAAAKVHSVELPLDDRRGYTDRLDMLVSPKLQVLQPDCLSYPCHQECCSAGCDVWPHERTALLERGWAEPADFSGPSEDDDGDVLFRTTVGLRGCTFLDETRGCRLHNTGFKPEVCQVVPRDADEADEMVADDMLPCRASWQF